MARTKIKTATYAQIYKNGFKNVIPPKPVPNLPPRAKEIIEKTRMAFYYTTMHVVLHTLLMLNEFPQIGPHDRQKVLYKAIAPFLRRTIKKAPYYGYPELGQAAKALFDRLSKINQISHDAIFYFRRDVLMLYTYFYPRPLRMYFAMSYTARKEYQERIKIKTVYEDEMLALIKKTREEKALIRAQKKANPVKNKPGRPRTKPLS